jgi:hypothetical protein
MKPEKKLRNKTKFYLWRNKTNETKRNFAVFCVLQNKRNFAKQLFCSLCFVFHETKKMMRNGNPTLITSNHSIPQQEIGEILSTNLWKKGMFLSKHVVDRKNNISSMFRTQFTHNFFVAEYYGLRNQRQYPKTPRKQCFATYIVPLPRNRVNIA